MITILVDQTIVFKEYEKEANELLNILRNSNSRYKDTKIEEMSWIYSFTYFIKKGSNTEEYYEKLYKMSFDERLEEELKKIRVNLAFSAGHFYLSDRVSFVSDTIKETVKAITVQKMVNEAEFTGDDSILNTIPFITDNEKPKPMSLQEQLKHAIDIEDFEEAARLRDEIKKEEE